MDQLTRVRDQAGASSAEYAAVTCGGVGFAGVLIKLLTSETGQKIITGIFDHLMDLLPF